MRTLLWISILAAAASAQPIEVKSLFQPAPLSGPWKHQIGDDPRWADPSFDDSSWPSVQMPEATARPDHGFSWYRFRVRLPETMPYEPLAFFGRRIWEWAGLRSLLERQASRSRRRTGSGGTPYHSSRLF